MPAIALSFSAFSWDWLSWRKLAQYLPLMAIAVGLSSCATRSAPVPRSITLQQQWALNPGDEIAGNTVAGSLGDISLYLKNAQVTAPFDGKLELSELEDCALYSAPEIPAYLFRLCGLRDIAYGKIKAGKTIGKGKYLSFATLRRQPDGTWIIVEPAKGVLERALAPG
ncbi:MAG: hypothetical protein ACR2FS_14685 [Phormidesmis sp.]